MFIVLHVYYYLLRMILQWQILRILAVSWFVILTGKWMGHSNNTRIHTNYLCQKFFEKITRLAPAYFSFRPIYKWEIFMCFCAPEVKSEVSDAEGWKFHSPSIPFISQVKLAKPLWIKKKKKNDHTRRVIFIQVSKYGRKYYWDALMTTGPSFNDFLLMQGRLCVHAGTIVSYPGLCHFALHHFNSCNFNRSHFQSIACPFDHVPF